MWYSLSGVPGPRLRDLVGYTVHMACSLDILNSKSVYIKDRESRCCCTFLFKWHVPTPKYENLVLSPSQWHVQKHSLAQSISISIYTFPHASYSICRLKFIPLVHVKTEIIKNAAIHRCTSVFTLSWKQPPNFYVPYNGCIWIQGICCLLLLLFLLLLLLLLWLKVQLHKYLVSQNIQIWPSNTTHTLF